MTIARAADEAVRGDRGDVVSRSVYAFRQNGRPMRESGYPSFVAVRRR